MKQGETAAKPRLVIVAGSPGSGKSTLAEQLAEKLGNPLLMRDDLKEAMMDVLPVGNLAESQDMGQAALDALCVVLEQLVGNGIDAAWFDPAQATAHPALDRSCAAMAQGEHRLARGLAYARYIAARSPTGHEHAMHRIPGAGHDADAVFGSPAGLAALFGERGRAAASATQQYGGCDAQRARSASPGSES